MTLLQELLSHFVVLIMRYTRNVCTLLVQHTTRVHLVMCQHQDVSDISQVYSFEKKLKDQIL